METTTTYIVLILSISIPLTQVFISMNYLKVFAFEYLTNSPKTWNPDYDRSLLATFLIFGSVSMYLAKQIWNGNVHNSWLLTFMYLIVIIFLSFISILYIFKIQKVKRPRIKSELVKNDKWRSLDKNKITDLFEYLIKTKKICTKSKMENYKVLFSDITIKEKLIWTGKFNGKFTYVTLILLYKAILKEDHFSKEQVELEISKNFLFEKKDLTTYEITIEELDSKSFDNAFDNIDFDNLKRYQKEDFENYLRILNITL